MSSKTERHLASLIGKRLALAGLLTVAAAVVLASLVQAQILSITTTYAGNNGFAGNMFDVTTTATIAVSEGRTIYVSTATPGSAGGVSFADEDILTYDSGTDTWSMVFDGSDVGLAVTSTQEIDAFHINADGSILLSLGVEDTIPDVGLIDDSDIVRFIPTSIGDNTTGTYEWFFDGSEVALDDGGEDIDAIGFAPDGRLIISTRGAYSVPGISGLDEDLIIFTGTLGETTSGTWAVYFDGSDVALEDSTEDVNGTWIDNNGDIYLTARGAFSVVGATGDGADIFTCVPFQIGDTTSCTTHSLFWDGSAYGLAGEVINGLFLPVNHPPVAEDDDYVTTFETPKTVAAPGVLDNDTDVDGNPLTAVLDSDPDGDVSVKADGSFVYTPTTGFRGEDTFTYHAFDGRAASNVATVTINVLDPTDADLKMAKVADADTPIERDTVVYTLTVTNNGPANATGVEISDILPSGVTYVADDGGGDFDGTMWDVGALVVDASATLHITVTVDAETTGTTITNTAVISALDQIDPVEGNDEAQAVITVVLPQADLEMGKEVDNKTPDENGTIVYTLMVTNNGPPDATGVEISDTLPSGVTYVDDDGGGDYDGTMWDVGGLDVTGSATLHITATVDAGTAGRTITNTAVISALDQIDLAPDNDEADATIVVKGGPSEPIRLFLPVVFKGWAHSSRRR